MAPNTESTQPTPDRIVAPGTTLSLAELLVKRGWSSKKLARELDKTESTVSRWRGGLVPSKENRERIYAAVEATQDEIDALGWEKEAVGA